MNGTSGRLVDLPDEIVLDLGDVTVLLGALDRASDLAAPDTEADRAIRRGIRLLTAKVWPELGDLLDEDDRE